MATRSKRKRSHIDYIEESLSDPLSDNQLTVVKSAIRGQGLFRKCKISADLKIIEYKGKLKNNLQLYF